MKIIDEVSVGGDHRWRQALSSTAAEFGDVVDAVPIEAVRDCHCVRASCRQFYSRQPGTGSSRCHKRTLYLARPPSRCEGRVQQNRDLRAKRRGTCGRTFPRRKSREAANRMGDLFEFTSGDPVSVKFRHPLAGGVPVRPLHDQHLVLVGAPRCVRLAAAGCPARYRPRRNA